MSIEAMKQALEALEYKEQGIVSGGKDLTNRAITSLRKAIQEETMRNVQRLGQEIEQGHEFVCGECVKCGASIEKQERKCENCGEFGPCCQQEPLEYWNAVEGWVKLDEVREHFDSVSCGTIYKNEGEGRVPLYAHPQPKSEWVGLTDEEIADEFYKFEAAGAWYQFAHAIEAKLKEKNT